ncbi:MAG: SDR family NAD(P)-dependent oxidoreductase [Myxococcota bacterium]|jgi:3-oxoacyl-[acyl-carrier protein] reductase|nr:SDR family NAD(P)-dependent oxidoreductase [Myxococcota bacterium]
MLDGKVAIVTGAARGLGREEALELARQGARVVVNDLGVSGDGSGRDTSAADAVVDEIKALGGEAVPHFGDVADWNDSQAMVQTAIDTYGDLNILVNNAGFCRDKMIFNMTEDDFDSVLRVHVKGSFCSLKFASMYWREKAKAEGGQVYGRIIGTASEAFLYCSVGQPNYAAGKAGITALTLSTGFAVQKYGVTANVICPRARTRMTDTGGFLSEMFAKPEEGFDTFDPANIAPFVAYLGSPAAEHVSGQVFTCCGENITVVGRPDITTPENQFHNEGKWTVEKLDAALGSYFAGRTFGDGYAIPGA